MKTIHKYPVRLGTEGFARVQLPVGARIVHVGGQTIADTIPMSMVWAEIDTDADVMTRFFMLFTTGQEITPPADSPFASSKLAYVGTHQFEAGTSYFVVHLYELFDSRA